MEGPREAVDRKGPCDGGEVRPWEDLDGVGAHSRLSVPAPPQQTLQRRSLSLLVPPPGAAAGHQSVLAF